MIEVQADDRIAIEPEVEGESVTLGRLQKIEWGLQRIERLTNTLGRTDVVPHLNLARFNENDPTQTHDFHQSAIKVGRIIMKLNVIAKPTLEEKAAYIKQHLEERLQKADQRFEEIRELEEGGFLPRNILARAAHSLFAFKDSFGDQVYLPDQICSPDSRITQGEAAVMAIAIADAYTQQDGERTFSLDQEFFGFFGKLCNALPPIDAAEIDIYSYQKAKQHITQKFSSQPVPAEVGEGGDQIQSLLTWIDSHVQDKVLFYEAILATEDYGDRHSIINLREKFRGVLQKCVDKFYSLHPEIIEEERKVALEVSPPAKPSRKAIEPVEQSEENGSQTPKVIQNTQNRKANTIQPEYDSSRDQLVMFYLEHYKDQVVREDIEEAHRVANEAGVNVLYNKADEILALTNLAQFRNKGTNLTQEEAENLRLVIRKLLTRSAKRSKT